MKALNSRLIRVKANQFNTIPQNMLVPAIKHPEIPVVLEPDFDFEPLSHQPPELDALEALVGKRNMFHIGTQKTMSDMMRTHTHTNKEQRKEKKRE